MRQDHFVTGLVVASTACMNAMFAPAVTMIRLPRGVDAVLVRASFCAMRLEQPGNAGDILVLIGFGPRESAARASASAASRGGP